MTEELYGTSYSKSLISSLVGSLDSELKAWRKRRLEAQTYPYLFVVARYEKVRVDGRVVSQGVVSQPAFGHRKEQLRCGFTPRLCRRHCPSHTLLPYGPGPLKFAPREQY